MLLALRSLSIKCLVLFEVLPGARLAVTASYSYIVLVHHQILAISSAAFGTVK